VFKAILGVDVFGQSADWDPIRKVADEFGLKVIEDSCEALGAEYKGHKVGTLGDYGVFAFYPNKQITTGEGGVIVTGDEQAANLMRALRNQGRAPGDTWLSHTYLGYNYRLDEMSAALGAVQMLRLQELLHKREQVAAWYSERLAEIPGVEVPFIEPFTTRMSWFVYVVRFDPATNRDALAKRLEASGVPVRPYFLPIHLQPYMVERFGYRLGDFPVTEDLGHSPAS
jgi:perosamine synthetase